MVVLISIFSNSLFCSDDLGISARIKYGFLLHVGCNFMAISLPLTLGTQNFTEKNTIPVFRTESQ